MVKLWPFVKGAARPTGSRIQHLGSALLDDLKDLLDHCVAELLLFDTAITFT